jgi:hypothetical protein
MKACGNTSLALACGFRIPKTPLLRSQPEVQNLLHLDGAYGFTSEVSGEEPVSYLRCIVLRDAEDVPEARKTGEPEIKRQMFRLRHSLQIRRQVRRPQ